MFNHCTVINFKVKIERQSVTVLTKRHHIINDRKTYLISFYWVKFVEIFVKSNVTRLKVNLALDHELTKTIKAIKAINAIKAVKTIKAIKAIKAI